MTGMSCIQKFPLFLLVACLVYFPAFKNDHVIDDGAQIGDNRDLDTRSIGWLFNSDYFEISKDLTYRPVDAFSHWLDRRSGPAAGHAANVVLHASVSASLYALGLRFLPAPAAFCGALIFLVHPASCEAVYVITYRENLLCALFLLWSILAAHSDRRFLAGLSFLLAVFSKETAAMLPVLLVAPAFLPEFKNFRRSLMVFLAVDLFYAFVRFVLLPGPGLFAGERHIPWVVEQGTIFTGYLKLLLFPARLSIDHKIPPAPALIEILPGLAAVTALSIHSAYRWAQKSAASIWWAWFLAFMIPVMGIIPIANVSAERYLYVPLLLPALGCGLAIHRISRTVPRFLLIFLLVIPLAARTHIRGYDFRSAWTLYPKELSINPASRMTAWALGRMEDAAGNRKEAKRLFERVIELDPLYYPAFIDLGYVERDLGDTGRSDRWFEAAYALAPADPEVLIQLAENRRMKGDSAAAEFFYREAVKYPIHPLGISQNLLDIHRHLQRVYHVRPHDPQPSGP